MYVVSIVILVWCVGWKFFVFCCVTLHELAAVTIMSQKHEAWVSEVQQELKDAITKCEALEQKNKDQAAELSWPDFRDMKFPEITPRVITSPRITVCWWTLP
jgi:hypothetical protein